MALKVTRFVVCGNDLTDKATAFVFQDRAQYAEYVVRLEDYYILEPIITDNAVILEVDGKVLFDETNSPDEVELQVTSAGSTIRIRKNKAV